MPHIDDIREPNPTIDEVRAEYKTLHEQLNKASHTAGRMEAVQRWDAHRRRLGSWSSIVQLRFQQNTSDPGAKANREYSDELLPQLTELEVSMKKRLLQPSMRAEVDQAFGPQAALLWEIDVLTFDPLIKEDLVEEAKLEANYTELLASAKFGFRGGTHNLSGIGKFHEDPDRAVRQDSMEVKWGWFEQNAEVLDDIFGRLVKLRDGMAKKLGCLDFVDLGYKRMTRIDYDRNDVDRYRLTVREVVVPLAQKIKQHQAEQLGLQRLMFWDDPIHDPIGNPKPCGDDKWMTAQAQRMFDAMGGGLGEFFELMTRSELLDLETREGKAGGGFCTSFPSYGVPFIFANFNGTKGDVDVFTHEMGHAFQSYLSRLLPLCDYLWPTAESCEIHSMSLEYLSFPHMDKFFGNDADRYRRLHLIQSILFLPYGVAIDHFQHLVYQKPDATPAERHAMWRQMESDYLPWRDYGDLPHLPKGGFWQLQRHIYLYPFYYIDYTLALTCALQFYVRAEEDPVQALSDYVALCRRGGEAPFQALVKGAGLTSPFEEGCLSEVVSRVSAQIA